MCLNVTPMDRSKIIAIVAGAISVFLAVAYLLLVQLLDLRGEMRPAPQSQVPILTEFSQVATVQSEILIR